MKYLSLIQAIVLLHGQKRPTPKSKNHTCDLEQFEHTCENIGLANKLAHEILGRTLPNLTPLSGLLLLLIDEMVDKACVTQQVDRVNFRFIAKDIRKYTGWSSSQLKLHLQQLKQQRYIHEEGEIYELVYKDRGKKIEYFVIDRKSSNLDLA